MHLCRLTNKNGPIKKKKPPWPTWGYLFHTLFSQKPFLRAGQTRLKTNCESKEGQNEIKMKDKHDKIFARNIFLMSYLLIINKNPSPGLMAIDHQTRLDLKVAAWTIPPQTPMFPFPKQNISPGKNRAFSFQEKIKYGWKSFVVLMTFSIIFLLWIHIASFISGMSFIAFNIFLVYSARTMHTWF